MQSGLPERPAFLPPGFGTVGHEDFVEIVVPKPVSYQPQTASWVVLSAVLIGAVAWGVFRAMTRYRNNAYRRMALHELGSLRAQLTTERQRVLGQLPTFLKRCALAAFPRDQVAALSGEHWLSFLDKTAPGVWSLDAQTSLQALVVGEPDDLAQEKDAALFQAVSGWIRKHRVPGARRV